MKQLIYYIFNEKEKNKMMIMLFVIVLFTPGLSVMAQNIRVRENTSFDVTAQYSGIPGDDIVNVYENTMGDYELNINGGRYKQAWHVEMTKTTDSWDSDFVLEVKRDPSDNRVTGGDAYLTVPDESTTAEIFFRSNNKKDIRKPNLKIQYRVSGVTASNTTPGTYTTTITYTLVGN